MKNKATKIITIVFGILLAFAGFEHGLFETLQGNKPTGGCFVPSIGPEIRWWIHGTEDAVTLIPNYLITGICAMCVGISIMVWSLFYLDKKHSATVFLILFILLVLVGGGVGFIPFFITTWAYATRMNKSLDWWKRKIKPKKDKRISASWLYTLIGVALCWLIAIEIAIFGYVPGIEDPDTRLAICWWFLLFAYILIHVTYILGFVYDIKSGSTQPK